MILAQFYNLVYSMAYRVLFVCLGNICRSPAAEGVFKALVQKASLDSEIQIDSAGTSGYHNGESADERMRDHAARRGYKLDTPSRQFKKEDFDKFDQILVMDEKNLRDVLALADESNAKKVRIFTDYCEKYEVSYVPDPYFGGPKGFERVLDIVEDGCANLLKKIQANL